MIRRTPPMDRMYQTAGKINKEGLLWNRKQNNIRFAESVL